MRQRDIVRHQQSATCPMQTGTIKDQQRDRARTNLGTNLLKVLVHGVGVDRGRRWRLPRPVGRPWVGIGATGLQTARTP